MLITMPNLLAFPSQPTIIW